MKTSTKNATVAKKPKTWTTEKKKSAAIGDLITHTVSQEGKERRRYRRKEREGVCKERKRKRQEVGKEGSESLRTFSHHSNGRLNQRAVV